VVSTSFFQCENFKISHIQMDHTWCGALCWDGLKETTGHPHGPHGEEFRFLMQKQRKRSTREVAVKILKHARSLQGGTSLLLATRVCRRPKQGQCDLKEDSVKIFLDIPCYTPKKDRKVIHHSFGKLFLHFSLGFGSRWSSMCQLVAKKYLKSKPGMAPWINWLFWS